MQKVPGVTGVKVSLNEGLTILDLGAGNSVTLVALRQIIRNNGFATNEAQVVVQGTVIQSREGLTFEVRDSKERLTLRTIPEAALDGWRARLTSAGSVEAVVSGRVDLKNPKALTLSVQKAEAP